MRTTTATLLALALFAATAGGGSSKPAAPPQPLETAPPAKPAGSKFTVDYVNPGFPPVQVEVLKAGSGKVAKVGAEVTVHYVANAVGQPVYASSRQQGSQPKTFVAGVGAMGILPGWDAAVVHMREGDLWKLTIPPELAYGANAGPKVPPNSTVEIEVEMLKVN